MNLCVIFVFLSVLSLNIASNSNKTPNDIPKDGKFGVEFYKKIKMNCPNDVCFEDGNCVDLCEIHIWSKRNFNLTSGASQDFRFKWAKVSCPNIVCFPNGKCVDLCDIGIYP
ncbi:unnamed protein product [Tenebrio molitor]|nr:unnamed protein product [Tenebrio molitor]